MADFTCYVQEVCPHYTSGDNKPPNHHVRLTVPCQKYIAGECPMPMEIQFFFTGEGVACEIEKIKGN